MMKYSTYTWDLVRALESASLPPARHQPHLLIPSAQTINQKKAKNPEIRFNSQQIISNCLGLQTQNPGLREIDLEPIAKRGVNRTEALVSLYWLSWSWHPKEPPNWISHKSTKVDPIRLSQTWKKSYQISKSYALCIFWNCLNSVHLQYDFHNSHKSPKFYYFLPCFV